MNNVVKNIPEDVSDEIEENVNNNERSTEDIVKFHKSILCQSLSYEEIGDSLRFLFELKDVTYDILFRTGVGRIAQKLRSCKNKIVARLSTRLVTKWKEIVAVYEEQLEAEENEAEENEAEDNNDVEHQNDPVTVVVTPPPSPSDSFSTPDIDTKTREALAKLLENKRKFGQSF